MKLCTKFERNRAIRGAVTAILVFDLMTLNIALRVALGSIGIIFTKFDLRQLIRASFMLIRYVTLWPWPLTSWPWTYICVGTIWYQAFKLCTKFERNWIILSWVIDDIARFRCAILGAGTIDKRFSWVRGPNFTKLGEDIGRSFPHKNFLSAFRYIAAFSNASGSKLSDVENDAKLKISHFLTPSLREN